MCRRDGSHPEQGLIKLAAETAKAAKIAFLMLPGVGTKEAQMPWCSKVSPIGSPHWSPNWGRLPKWASMATRTWAWVSPTAWRRCGPVRSRSTGRAAIGAGAGNAPVEALIAVFDKIGVKTGIDFFDIADAAEEVVAPAMPAECPLDRNALIMGYSGVYSSFLKHAIRQSERYGVPAHNCCTEPGSAS